MKLNFGQEVLVVPASVLSCCDDIDAAYLRVMLWLASDLTLCQKPKQLAKLSGCDEKTVTSALEHWCKSGVLSRDGGKTAIPVMAAVAETPNAEKSTEKRSVIEKHLHRADEIPNYTSTQLAELMEARDGVRVLVDEAQRIMGKIFNMSEVNILVGMLDYLGMSEESVLLLLAHCARIEKKGLRAIEKYAIRLVDQGISTPEALEEEFHAVEALRSFEGQIRTMFGMKARSLTAKEEKILRAWLSWGFNLDGVRMAYEITVNSINEASLPYANSILKAWHEDGLHTLGEIQAKLDEDKAKKEGENGGSVLGTSFDVDEFFEAALNRGFSARRED